MNREYFLFSGPLSAPSGYNASFKVDVRLNEPLWKEQFSPSDVALEILTLCSQLEPLCRKEYCTSSGKLDSTHKVVYQNTFEPTAQVLKGKMKEMLHFLPEPQPSVKDYLRQTGLAILYPRVASYLSNPEHPGFYNQKSSMDNYFQHCSMLNQMVTLSHQLNSDAFNLTNHKYIAHQIALLYQSVNQGGVQVEEYKKNIESNFKSIKASLGTKEKDSVPKLPQEQKEWVHLITSSLLDKVASLPPGLTQPMISAMAFVDQL